MEIKHKIDQFPIVWPSENINIHITHTLDPTALGVLRALSENLLTMIGALPDLKKVITIMTALDDSITTLQGDVSNLTSVVGSAEALINGFAQRLQDAIAAALAAGATDAELSALNDLHSAISDNASGLAAAVAANTPAPASSGGGTSSPPPSPPPTT